MNKEINKGKFIVLSGLDGSGKSLQSRLLSDGMTKMGVRNLLTEEHWKGDVLGSAIDTVVELKKEKLDPLALQMTFVGNRVNHTSVLIKPALVKGKLVISDRYSESTINYADNEYRQFLIEETKRLTEMGKILRPDLTILVDVPVEVAMDRLEKRRKGIGGSSKFRNQAEESKINRESIFEKKSNLERVRKNYLERFNGSDQRMIIVDGVGTIEEVGGRIMCEIQRRCLSSEG